MIFPASPRPPHDIATPPPLPRPSTTTRTLPCHAPAASPPPAPRSPSPSFVACSDPGVHRKSSPAGRLARPRRIRPGRRASSVRHAAEGGQRHRAHLHRLGSEERGSSARGGRGDERAGARGAARRRWRRTTRWRTCTCTPLDLPAKNPTQYKFVQFDWNPAGHEPAGVYDLPHFDFHFYTVSRRSAELDPAERSAVRDEGGELSRARVSRSVLPRRGDGGRRSGRGGRRSR